MQINIVSRIPIVCKQSHVVQKSLLDYYIITHELVRHFVLCVTLPLPCLCNESMQYLGVSTKWKHKQLSLLITNITRTLARMCIYNLLHVYLKSYLTNNKSLFKKEYT